MKKGNSIKLIKTHVLLTNSTCDNETICWKYGCGTTPNLMDDLDLFTFHVYQPCSLDLIISNACRLMG